MKSNWKNLHEEICENQEVFDTGSISKETLAGSGPALRVFTPTLRLLWLTILSLTVVAEVIPLPLLPPLPFYSYKVMKVLFFVVLGYLAPLAFWRFNALTRGIFLAAISATFVETLQGLIHSGHSFHWYEMLIKLGLILFGFTLALDGRYERKISLGRIQIRLVGEHLQAKPPLKK